MARNKKTYTLMLMPDTPGKVRRLALTPFRRLLLAAVAGAVVIGVAAMTFGLAVTYFESLRLSAQVDALKDQNVALSQENLYTKRQLSALAEKMEAMDIAMDEVDKLDRTLRKMAHASTDKSGSAADIDAVSAAQRADLPAMHRAMENLTGRALERRLSLSKIQKYFEDRESVLLSLPADWPVKGWVSSGFGMRKSPFTGEKKFHEGIDIVAPIGVPVLAPGTGIVAYKGSHENLGKYMVIKHGQGTATHYGHLAAVLVEEGDMVKRGQPIAMVGNSGRSTGPHLHYEVRLHGVPVDPMRYLPKPY